MNNKITFFMSSMGRGGAERVVSILSRKYCENGWTVDICMLLHNYNDYPLDERVRVLDFSKNGKSKIGMLCKIRKYMKHEKPTVAVPFLSKTSALFYIATLGLQMKSTRVVVSERIDPYAVQYSSILRKVIDRSFLKADSVVFQTKRAKSFYSEKIQAKSTIIGNPVTMNITKSNISNHVIVNAGRLEKQKNQKMLIEAFNVIAKDYPDYVLHVYGDGSLRGELENQIKNLGLKDRVLLRGNQLDYQEWLAEAEFFVLSSDYEGLSNALIEAMRLGIPCISTNCAGSDEIISNNENGLLTSIGNGIELASAMKKMIDNSDLREKLGKNAMEASKEFDTEVVIQKWRKVFELA